VERPETDIMKRYIAGVDLGATHTKIAVLDLRGRVLSKDTFLTKKYRKDSLIKAVAAALNGLIDKNKIQKKDFLGLGIGVPGLVDFKRGLVFYFVNIPDWKNVPLKKEMRGITGLPVFVDNDVNAMALGELRFGAGKGHKEVICLTLGTGAGGAVVTDGRIYRGADTAAGEIGHIPINENGPLCNCGSRGCLEAYVGKDYFLKDVKRGLRKGAKSIVINMAHGRLSGITPELLQRAAEKGDSFAIGKWREYGRHIGSALAGIVNLLNPELIIIGGGMSGAYRHIAGPIREVIDEKAMRIQKKTVKLARAKLGNDAGVIGAAELVKISAARGA